MCTKIVSKPYEECLNGQTPIISRQFLWEEVKYGCVVSRSVKTALYTVEAVERFYQQHPFLKESMSMFIPISIQKELGWISSIKIEAGDYDYNETQDQDPIETVVCGLASLHFPVPTAGQLQAVDTQQSIINEYENYEQPSISDLFDAKLCLQFAKIYIDQGLKSAAITTKTDSHDDDLVSA